MVNKSDVVKKTTTTTTKKNKWYPYYRRWWYRRNWKNWYYNRKKSPYNVNYFNYKADYVVDLYLAGLTGEFQYWIADRQVNTDITNALNVFKPIMNSTNYNSCPGYDKLTESFDYIKCKGISVKYMPFTPVRDNPNFMSGRPNLIMGLMTYAEYFNADAAYGEAVPSQANINAFIDRPYTKWCRWEEKLTIYRRFPWSSKNSDHTQTDNNMFYQYIPITEYGENAKAYFLIRNTSVNNPMIPPENQKYGPFGQLRVRVYFRLKASKY